MSATSAPLSATSAPLSATSAPRFSTSFEGGLAAVRAGDRRAAFGIAMQQVLLGLIPVIFVAALARSVLTNPHSVSAVDFSDAYWPAGHRLIHGGNPYSWTVPQIKAGIAFVYPALSALVYVPFGLIARESAATVMTFICIAMTPLILWVLKVRDWRVYGITLLWLPVYGAWQTSNETIFLVAMVALTWRYRDNPKTAALLTAAAISLKPFIWPLALWLLVTRRWRASVYTVVAGLVLNVIAWSVVGFGEIHVYLHDASVDSRYAWRAGYSVAAIAGHLGSGYGFANALTVLVSIALAGAIVYVGFVKRRERQALTLTILLMLAASPLVWSHYFALLLVPMAIERPRLQWLWSLPLLMWVCPPSFNVHGWQVAVAWAVAGTMFAVLMRSGGSRSRRVPGVRPLALARS